MQDEIGEAGWRREMPTKFSSEKMKAKLALEKILKWICILSSVLYNHYYFIPTTFYMHYVKFLDSNNELIHIATYS
jgi:hypothetical protein